MAQAPPDRTLANVRANWDAFAARFTATFNTRISNQCAAHLHAHLQLVTAHNVLEVAAGAGIGSLDALTYLERGAQRDDAPRSFVVTDLSPMMVSLAIENLKTTATHPLLNVQVMEANGQDLVAIKSGSMDRYIASLCLQLCPDPDALLREARRVLTDDGLAGFTIWARPENSGFFSIDAALGTVLGKGDGADHLNFTMGKDLPALRQKFTDAGFTKVMIWPFVCVLEMWSGEEFATFYNETFYVEDEGLRKRRFDIAKRLADEWLAKGFPIGLETYIIVARP